MATDPLASLYSDPLVLGVVALGFMTVIAFLVSSYLVRLKSSGRSSEPFEKTNISDILKPIFDQKLKVWGSPNGSPIRKDYKTLGIVHRDLTVGGRHAEDADVPDEALSDLLDKGILSEKQVESIKDHLDEPCKLFHVRKPGLLNKWQFYIFDVLMGRESYGFKLLVPETDVKDTPRGIILIDKDVEIEPFIGMWVANRAASFAVISAASFRQLYEQALEDHLNYHYQVNHFDAEFSQTLQRLEKLAELDARRFGGSMMDDISNT